MNDHFGRTPASTPIILAVDEQESDDENAVEENRPVDATERVKLFLNEDSSSDSELSDNENGENVPLSVNMPDRPDDIDRQRVHTVKWEIFASSIFRSISR